MNFSSTFKANRALRNTRVSLSAFVAVVVAALTLFAGIGLAGTVANGRPATPHVLTLGGVPQAAPSNDTVSMCPNTHGARYVHCNALLLGRGGRASTRGVTIDAKLGENGAYSPAYLQSAYNVASLDAAGNAGVGQVVAIVDAYNNPVLATDLAYYRRHYGLPACPSGTVSKTATGCVFEQVNEQGATSPMPANKSTWGLEEAIDAEVISAICPNCQILMVEATTSSMNDLGASVSTAVSLGATVVSNSYGSPEFADENNLSNEFYQHPGVPLVAAAGDNGYGVQFPAASPNVVAVGGTTLTQSTDTGTRDATETVWNGSGSGCSLYEAKPAWQHDTGCANRSVADVAADANPNTGVWIYDTFAGNGMDVAGGTSVATAIVSGIFALSSTGSPTTQSPASDLYENATALFRVTQGSNSGCGTYLCNAAQSSDGYNGPTGLGTPGASPNSLAAFRPASATAAIPLHSLTPVSTSNAPSDVEALPGDGEAVVGWSVPANDGTSTVTSYVVSDAAGQGCTYVVATPETDSCTVSNLVDGKDYTFSVTAMNKGQELTTSAPSNTVTPTSSLAITKVAAGNDFGCALFVDGSVSCWGDNNDGQLGDGSTTPSATPVKVPGVSDAVQIALDANGVCAIRQDGAVWCWGDGVLRGSSAAAQVNPKPVLTRGLGEATQLSLSSGHACAVLEGGAVWCWGNNNDGQLGNGTTKSTTSPTQVSGVQDATSVVTGATHTCAVLTTNAVWCWGSGAYGALGNNATTSSTTPVAVRDLANVAQVGVGDNNTCARLVNQSVWCWGYNGDGELGNGTLTNSLTPVAVSAMTDATSIDTSAYGTCALVDAEAQCWGYHDNGQLNLSAATDADTPTTMTKLSSVTQIGQSFDYGYTCAVLHTSTVSCWSDDSTSPAWINTAGKTAATKSKTRDSRPSARQ